MKKNPLQRPESAIQFDNIYREHHDPKTKEQRKIMNNRKIREDNNKEDHGL